MSVVAGRSVSWPLRCPVDNEWLAPSVSACPGCGLGVGPLRSLAAVAGSLLDRARHEPPDVAVQLVSEAQGLVPPSEAFFIDAADSLVAADATSGAIACLERALAIAPGRHDIRERVRDLRQPVTPTVGRQVPVVAVVSPRGSLMAEHAMARQRREDAGLGSTAYIEACEAVAKIEVAIARLEAGSGGRPA